MIKIDGNKFRIVSLDGHRISIRDLNLKQSYDPVSVIVPGKTMNEISKIINGSLEEVVNIYTAENHIIFEFDNTIVVSRLIEGKYYDIDRMISSDYETKLTVKRKEFLDSITRSLLMVNESDKKPIVFDIQKLIFNMKISTTRGNFEEEITMIKEGKNIKIAFNPRFILDVLRVIDDENVTLYLLSPKSPLFIKDDDESYIYVILPVNFNAA